MFFGVLKAFKVLNSFEIRHKKTPMLLAFPWKRESNHQKGIDLQMAF